MSLRKQLWRVSVGTGWLRPEKSKGHTATLEIADSIETVERAFEAVTGKKLTVLHENGNGILRVPKFSILACVDVEPKGISGV